MPLSINSYPIHQQLQLTQVISRIQSFLNTFTAAIPARANILLSSHFNIIARVNPVKVLVRTGYSPAQNASVVPHFTQKINRSPIPEFQPESQFSRATPCTIYLSLGSPLKSRA